MDFVTNVTLCTMMVEVSSEQSRRKIFKCTQSAAAAAAAAAAALCVAVLLLLLQKHSVAAFCSCSSSCAGWPNLVPVH